MAFHFKRRERIAKAVRRICCERIETALKDLRRSNRARSVHDVRKEIKKIRAVLRLARKGIEKCAYRKCNDLLRVAAECLTGIRDAHVVLKALEELLAGKINSFPNLKGALKRNIQNREEKFLERNSAVKVKEILRRLKKCVKDLELDSDGWSMIAAGLMKSFRRGKKTFFEVQKNPKGENLHEWRKRIKDLWYDLRLLCPTWPEELEAVATELETLSDLLGEDHDLVMLREFGAAAKIPETELNALNQLVSARQKELRFVALKTGEQFYSEKTKHFCKRFGIYWKLWRKK